MLTETIQQVYELTIEEKAAAWDRHVALSQQLQANEREIQSRFDRRYQLQKLIENNVKETLVKGGQEVEQCQVCNFDLCNCERAAL